MHKRYNFELIVNEPDYKVFSTKSDPLIEGEECFVELSHDYNDLEMIFRSKIHMEHGIYENKGFWKRLATKLKICYNVLKGNNFTFEGVFRFRGRNHIDDFVDMLSLVGKEVIQETNELVEARKEIRKLKR